MQIWFWSISNRIKYTFIVIKSEKWLFKFLLDSNSKSETKNHRWDDILAGLTFPINTFQRKITRCLVIRSCFEELYPIKAFVQKPFCSRIRSKNHAAFSWNKTCTETQVQIPWIQTVPKYKTRTLCSMGPTPWFCETQHPSTLQVSKKENKKKQTKSQPNASWHPMGITTIPLHQVQLASVQCRDPWLGEDPTKSLLQGRQHLSPQLWGEFIGIGPLKIDNLTFHLSIVDLTKNMIDLIF